MKDDYKEWIEKVMNGEISPEQAVEDYNKVIKEEAERSKEEIRPHEHI